MGVTLQQMTAWHLEARSTKALSRCSSGLSPVLEVTDGDGAREDPKLRNIWEILRAWRKSILDITGSWATSSTTAFWTRARGSLRKDRSN